MHEIKGRVTRQAHVAIPEGTVEEEFGRQGFYGRVSHLYRLQPMVNWTRIEGPLQPRAFNPLELIQYGGDYIEGRVAVLENQDIRIHTCGVTTPMPYIFRNADADEVFFVHQGSGQIKTDLGPLPYETGDYVVLPRGVGYQLIPAAPTQLLIVESRDEIQLPERGMLGPHALFDPAVVQTPEPYTEVIQDQEEWEIKVQREGQLTSIFYPFNPFNVVGWKGDLAPWRLNMNDIRPVISERYHLPPSAHTTFLTDAFVICSFLPRGLEVGDAKAVKVPFYHANIDFDEVIFYHDGDFFSRQGISAGMLTWHPQGIHHGPQPGAVARSQDAQRTEEKAVMIDTKRPLQMTEAAEKVQWSDYWQSWQASFAKGK